jgi:hypothetical protein
MPSQSSLAAALSTCALLLSTPASAVTTAFFDASQTMTLDTSGTTSDTISTEGYLFTYTLDKLFTGGVRLSTPIGRTQLVQWPTGLHAQAVTTGPVTGPAQITIRRVDGGVFDLDALNFKLLANTWATGADLEITPMLDGNDGPQVFLDASGAYSNTFSYSQTLSDYRGFNTSTLKGYDTYNLSLFVDFALTGITLTDPSQPVPEPETWGMMLAGLGVVGFAVRQRKRATA